jgi:hypothetical protein
LYILLVVNLGLDKLPVAKIHDGIVTVKLLDEFNVSITSSELLVLKIIVLAKQNKQRPLI